MVKTVGKITLISWAIVNFFNCYALDITLRALNTEGTPIEQAAVGKPFVLEVVVCGTNGSTEQPTIIGIQLFEMSRTSYQMSSINGETTISYKYNVMIDQKGEYKIGPAEIRQNSERFISKPLYLKVAAQEVEKNGNAKTRKTTKKVLLHFFTDKKDVVVGQKVGCMLRFYYLDTEKVKLDRIIPPDIKGVYLTKKEGMYTGSKKTNDSVYKYWEFRWDLYPKVAGEIVLPASRADFTIRTDNGFFRGFASLFNLGAEKKYIYSNALTLNVAPLPPYDGVVDAVGDFKKFDAYVDRAVVRQGDGIVLTLELEGDGDLENLDITEIQDMPHTMKYYFSKSSITDSKGDIGSAKKKFEFIVQGLEPGEWKIPKQKFTYFDVKSRDYKTIKTPSLLIRILPQAISRKSKTKDADDKEVSAVEGLVSINTNENWHLQTSKPIPYWIFLILIMFPLVGLGLFWIKNWLSAYCTRYTPQSLKKKAFKNAEKRLGRAVRKKDVSMLYSIFITLFAERLEMQERNVTQTVIMKAMEKHGFSKDEIKSWEVFFSEISAFIFYREASVEQKPFDEAKDWIERFKSRL